MVTVSAVPKLSIVLAIAVVLAGCVSDPGVEKVQSEDAAPVEASPTSVSEAPNRAPVAVLTASIADAAAAIEDGTLTIDAGTTVAFSSADSSDPDGDVLTFAWTVDDAAAGTEATLSQAFPTAGTYAVALTVSDGSLQVTEALDVVVQAVTVAPPVTTGGAPVTYTITGAFPDPVFHDPALGEPVVEGTPVDHPFDVPAGATALTAYLTWSDVVAHPVITDLDLYLLDATGTEQGKAASATVFELAEITDPAKLPAGTWNAHINPFEVPPEVVEYTLEIVIWTGAPTVTEFAGSHAGAVNVGAGAPVETAADVHLFTVPEGTTAIMARLTWEIPGVVDCTDRDPVIDVFPASIVPTATNDFDFYVYGPTGAEVFHSGDAISCEFGLAGGALAPGAYTVEVVPFVVAAGDYTLTVSMA